MTASTADANLASGAASERAPFLLWPVARREFYQAIIIALSLPLLWGVALFGIKAALIVCSTLGGAVITQALLRRSRRGRLLTFNHTIASALMLACLTAVQCPLWLAGAASALMTLVIWLVGPPGRHRVHVGLLTALMLSLVVGRVGTGPVLVKEALFVGNLHRTSPVRRFRWPAAAPVVGNDAITVPSPDMVLAKTLRSISDHPEGLKARATLDNAFGIELPPPAELFLGVMPGRIGVVAILGIILGGLLLAYRHILQPASWAVFLLAVLLGLVFGPLSAHTFHHEFWQSLGGLWYLPKERALYLIFVELCTSDFLFASVFILAMPGTLPLSPRARWVFLLAAGILAALFARIGLPLPPATTALLLLQPIGPWLDSLLPRRTWMRT